MDGIADMFQEIIAEIFRDKADFSSYPGNNQ